MNNFTTHNLQSSNTIRYIFCIHIFCIEIHLFELAFSLPKKVMILWKVKSRRVLMKRERERYQLNGYCKEREIKLTVAYHFVNELTILVLYKMQPQPNNEKRATNLYAEIVPQMPFIRWKKRFVQRATACARVCVCVLCTRCIIAITHIMQSSSYWMRSA